MVIIDHIAKEEIEKQDTESKRFLFPPKNLIVEFVGPTGSGKTTNCRYFSGLLKECGLKVYLFRDVKDYFYGLKYYSRLYIILRTLVFYGLDILSYTAILIHHGIYSFNSIFRYIKLCVFNTVLEQFVKTRKVDVLLLDQWIIQGLWSATIFKLETYNTLQDELKRFYFKSGVVLYFEIDEATASRRIGLRESHRSRFDNMDSEKRLEASKKYNAYLFQLYKNSECINKLKFSTKVSPSENAENFLYQLKNTIIYEQ